MNKQLLKISASSIDTFLSCRKKYWFSKVMNIQPVERPEALDFGSAVHKALAYIFNAMRNDDCEKEIVRQYALDQINQHAIEYCMSEENTCKALALVDSYIDLYFDEDRLNFEVLDVEKYFERALKEHPGCDICTHGYFDTIVKNRHDGKVYVLEHKTSGMLNDDYLTHSHFDTQVMIYMDACHDKYGRCDGVIYDVLAKPKHSMSQGESDDEFESRKSASKTGKIKRKESETKDAFISRVQASFSEGSFVREKIECKPETLNKFIECELDGIITDIHYCDSYYRCTGNCLKFGACPYMDLCSGKASIDNLGDKFINCDDATEN